MEHAGVERALVPVVGNRIPAPENEILEPSERHEFLNERIIFVGTLAQTNPVHLGQTADGRGDALADALHTRDERRGHGTEAGEENTELAGGRSNLRRLLHGYASR